MTTDSDGFPPEGASRALLSSLATGPDIRIFAPLPAFGTAGEFGTADERPITADQTHRSVVVGERVVVKWFRPPLPPPHRSLAILGHLADVGFARTATPYAAVFTGQSLTALVTAFLPDAVDGWEWCVDDAFAGTDIGTDLGNLTADLHAALATPSAEVPVPVKIEADLDRAARAANALDEAVLPNGIAGDPWLESIAPRMRAGLEPLADTSPSPVLRIHGDLHVGQVLRWRDGVAVIDFDGNPTVGADTPQPLARDVAQMQTSIEHVGQIALRRGADQNTIIAWVRSSIASFRTAYAGRLDAHGYAELFDPDLVAPFAIEQECRELIYAAKYLPRWRYAPIGVLHSWYPELEYGES